MVVATSLRPLDLGTAVGAAEALAGGRGVLTMDDTATGRRFAHRDDALSPMDSIFRSLLAAAFLERIDAGTYNLARAIRLAKANILGNSPVSEKHVGSTETVEGIDKAAVIYFGNTAVNLLLSAIDGLAG